jgi:hypothetical protein
VGPDGEPKIENCDNCGREMIIKRGKWGAFLACTGYPDCKTTRRLKAGTRKALQPDELLDEKCPECDSQLVKKHGPASLSNVWPKKAGGASSMAAINIRRAISRRRISRSPNRVRSAEPHSSLRSVVRWALYALA